MVSKTALIVAALLLSGAGLAVAHGFANEDSPLGAAFGRAAPLLGRPPRECAPGPEGEGEEPGAAGANPRCRNRAPAPFHYDQGTGVVEGRHVSFSVEGGSLTGYTSQGPWADARIFDAVTVDGLEGPGAVRGGAYRAGDKEAGLGLVAFNAPNAALLVLAGAGATVTYDVADDVSIEVLDSGDVQLTRGDASARLHVRNGTLTVEGDRVTAALSEHGAAGFAIEGYPRLLAGQKGAIRAHR